MKKKIFALLLVLCLMIQPASYTEAKDTSVTVASSSMTSTSASVSGSTEALAVMVRVTDSSNNLVAMQSFPVNADGNFSAEISGINFADGTYTISVADYEGGSWATVTETVGSASTTEPTPDPASPTPDPASPTPDPTSPTPDPTSPTPDPAAPSSSGSSSTTDGTPASTPAPTVTQAPTTVPAPEPAFDEIISTPETDTVKAVFDAGKIDEKPAKMTVVPDSKDKNGAALLNALLTEEQQAAYRNESIEIVLSVSSSTLSSSEEKACEEGVEALETMMSDGEATVQNVDVPEELEAVFSGSLEAPVDADGEAGKPKIEVAKVYDFSVSMSVGNSSATEVHDLGDAKLVVNFGIDETLMNTNPLIRRIFFMLHLMSNGNKEVLPVDVDTKTLKASVEFGSCSTFVLAYTDVAEFTEPGATLKSSKYNAKYKVIEGGNVNGKTGVLEYVAPIKKKAKHTVYSKVTIDNITYKVKSIAANAFKDNKTVSSVKIGQYITTIGENAFYGCTALKSVTLGKRVLTINTKAFCKAGALEEVIVKSTKLKAANIGKSVWSKAGPASGITFTVPASKLNAYKKLFGKFGTVRAE